MGREITLGDEVIDQFPIFESDGYTKKSGETLFFETVWKDGVSQGTVVTIAEIGVSGEYKASFTPDDTGFWVLEIVIAYNNDIFSGEYTVKDATAETAAYPVGTPFDPTGGLP